MSEISHESALRTVHEIEDLVEHVRTGEKPEEEWCVGTEHEKIGVYSEGLVRVPYEGERGIEKLLNIIADSDGWNRVYEEERVIALKKGQASITLEPGGQLELSGAPLPTIHDTCREFQENLRVVRAASEPLGILWLSSGIDPCNTVESVPRMPKQRYEIMRDYLPRRGALALDMMHLTATVQANFDFSDESDMVDKMRTAMGLTPIVSAIFANSGIACGKDSGFVSRRVHIWQHTDPDRCGMLPFVFEPDFGYRRYIEWALDVPMFFLLRADKYYPMQGRTFRSFLESGFNGTQATLLDFELHMTTLFPEVRLKRFIEVRGADSVPSELVCALPALWKGLLYDIEARKEAWALVSHWSYAQREEAVASVAKHGLAAVIEREPVLELAREVVRIAKLGLVRIGHSGVLDSDESGYLEPLWEQLQAGKSPGQLVLERWEGPWDRSFDRLVNYVRF